MSALISEHGPQKSHQDTACPFSAYREGLLAFDFLLRAHRCFACMCACVPMAAKRECQIPCI